jgi:hypothetical protein
MKYAEARRLVTSPDYVPKRQTGAPKHPWDLTKEELVDQTGLDSGHGWGEDYGFKVGVERLLIGYIHHYYGCKPAPGERASYIRQTDYNKLLRTVLMRVEKHTDYINRVRREKCKQPEQE